MQQQVNNTDFGVKNEVFGPGTVAQACNCSYLESGNWRIMV
jgi:hypothetical protein